MQRNQITHSPRDRRRLPGARKARHACSLPHNRCRAISALIILLLVATLFAGCTSTTVNNPGTPAPETASAAATTPSPQDGTEASTAATTPEATQLPQVNLVWYALGDKPADYDDVFAQINEATSSKIACTIETKFISWAEF